MTTAEPRCFPGPTSPGEGSHEQTADKTPGNDRDARHVPGAGHRSVICQGPGHLLDRPVHDYVKEKKEKSKGRIGAGSTGGFRSISSLELFLEEIKEEQEVGHEFRQLHCRVERRVDQQQQEQEKEESGQ